MPSSPRPLWTPRHPGYDLLSALLSAHGDSSSMRLVCYCRNTRKAAHGNSVISSGKGRAAKCQFIPAARPMSAWYPRGGISERSGCLASAKGLRALGTIGPRTTARPRGALPAPRSGTRDPAALAAPSTLPPAAESQSRRRAASSGRRLAAPGERLPRSLPPGGAARARPAWRGPSQGSAFHGFGALFMGSGSVKGANRMQEEREPMRSDTKP
jgi:hypothetical protein